jgi:hypothetical protein
MAAKNGDDRRTQRRSSPVHSERVTALTKKTGKRKKTEKAKNRYESRFRTLSLKSQNAYKRDVLILPRLPLR